MKIDQIVIICNGCKGERLFYPKPIITSAEELIAWTKTKPTPCVCGAPSGDVRCRLMPEADLSRSGKERDGKA